MYKINELKTPILEFQSPWIYEIYNKYLPYKTDGFLVEIGVGHTVYGSDVNIGADWAKRFGSNTGDLLDLGWSGIYIEPVEEYCDELILSHQDNLDRLKIINMGCSNLVEKRMLYYGDTFIHRNREVEIDPKYKWLGRTVQCKPTSIILSENNCPKHIDIMSIDVEGYEHRVLLGLDYNIHQPKIIVVEINQVDCDRIFRLLKEKCGSYILIQKDELNAAFVNGEI